MYLSIFFRELKYFEWKRRYIWVKMNFYTKSMHHLKNFYSAPIEKATQKLDKNPQQMHDLIFFKRIKILRTEPESTDFIIHFQKEINF